MPSLRYHDRMTTQRKITPVQRRSASGKPLDARYTAAVIPTGILAVLAQVAGEEGVEVDPWLTGLGISRAQMDDAEIRVSYRQASLIIKRALRAIPCGDI